jgi:RHS repeat-associated protein
MIILGTQTTQFAYNGDGVRTSKTVAGDTTDYVLDLAARLPVVISDTEAVYLYGLDIIAQQQSDRYYYMHDALGSVRQLVDTTGEIETNYAYDPFGVPLVGGDVYNPYQYTGEAWDGEVELLYLRARYYRPEVGRFLSKDPVMPDAQDPSGSQAWVYVGNNPVNATDPSGMAPFSGAYDAPAGSTERSWDDRNLTWWLYQELVTNVDGPEASQIRRLWNSRNPLDKAAGAQKWINLVADGCRWDFKDRIHDLVGDTIMLRHIAGGRVGYRWYEYSVPGNIFFGWMGMAVGLPDWMLHVGAAYAEVTDPEYQRKGDCTITEHVSHQLEIDLLGAECELELDVCVNPHWWRTILEEPGDFWNVEFGIQLFKAHGPHLGFEQLYAFLGEKGWWLTEASQTPGNLGRQWNMDYPYQPGYFNGLGCGEGPFRCRPKQ